YRSEDRVRPFGLCMRLAAGRARVKKARGQIMAEGNSKTAAIFIEVRNRRPDEWTEYLDKACQGDAHLRDRVWTLLHTQKIQDDWVAKLGLPCAETDGDPNEFVD